jgi:hypothetical protein
LLLLRAIPGVHASTRLRSIRDKADLNEEKEIRIDGSDGSSGLLLARESLLARELK